MVQSPNDTGGKGLSFREAAFDVCPTAIGVTRLSDGVIIGANQAFLELLDYSHEEVIGKTSAVLGAWRDPVERVAAFQKLARGGGIPEKSSCVRRSDGTIRYVRFSAVPTNIGTERCMVGTLRDVTDEVIAEQRKAILTERLNLAISLVPIAFFHQDVDLRYTDVVNPQIYSRREDYIGRGDYDLFSESDADALTALKKAVILSGARERRELRITGHTGERWLDIVIEPEKDQNGNVIGLIGAALNITEHRCREQQYRTVLEDQTELIARYRPDHVMVYANEVYCRFFGKTESDIVGRPWQPQAFLEDVPLVEEKIRSLSPDNPVVMIENRVFSGAGEVRWMQFVNRAFFNGKGQIAEIQSVGRDITDRKIAEMEAERYRTRLDALLEETDRLRELQRKEISREIHDEIGSLLTGIRFKTEALRHSLADTSGDTSLLDDLAKLVGRANSSVRAICNQLRPPSLDDFGLVHTCRWYVKEWERALGIKVRGRFPRTSGPGVPDQLITELFRVLQELLNNVAKHSGAKNARVSLSINAPSICLAVADDGKGFPATSGAAGLGLLGVRERIARYGGRVEINTGDGGSVVKVCISNWNRP